MSELESILPEEIIVNKIYLIRGFKVMLDSDLAELYGVETKRLKEQVRRNIERFPEDFMFETTNEEYNSLKFSLRSQFATLKNGRGQHTKYMPMAFTEHGVLMLSNIVNSERAIKVSIQIIRVFARMRQMLSAHKEILLKLEQIEKKDLEQDQKIMLIFEYLKQLESSKIQETEQKQRSKIGYK